VGYAAGKVSNAAALVRANSEYLYHTDNASLSTGDIDYTVQIWVYLDSKSGVESIISKDSTGSNCEYALYYNSSTDRFVFRVYSSSGVTIGEVTANALGSPALSTWYHILIWHDSVNNQVGVRINDTYQNTAATTGVPSDTTATFYVGANEGTNYWNGRIDETAFWKRLLTADEKTWLYNGGSGRAYGETDYAVGAHEELCVVGRWSGGTRDVAVCFDDGSGSNGDTRTTFKNVSGDTLDVTCSVEVD
jgi:hypothetical protein